MNFFEEGERGCPAPLKEAGQFDSQKKLIRPMTKIDRMITGTT